MSWTIYKQYAVYWNNGNHKWVAVSKDCNLKINWPKIHGFWWTNILGYSEDNLVSEPHGVSQVVKYSLACDAHLDECL